MDYATHLKNLNDTRQRVWHEAKAILDGADAEHRDLTGEEQAKWQRCNERLDELAGEIDRFSDREQREAESAAARVSFERQYGRSGGIRSVRDTEQAQADQLRTFLSGEGPRTLHIPIGNAAEEKRMRAEGADDSEIRALLWDTGSAGSLVPTLLATTLYQYLEASMSMMRAPTTKIITPTGDPLNIPRLNTHAIATQVIAQGTAIGGTDPSFLTTGLNAFKYGELVQVSSETLQDSPINVVDFVARDVGRAVGRKIGTALAAGVGTTEPQGLMVGLAGGGAGSQTTGGSLIKPTYENLVDTEHTIADTYRNMGNAGWFMRDATVAYLRKLRADAGGTTGPVLWSPSPTRGLIDGEPDTLLGYPVYTDPGVASLASNARVLAFVDFSAYYVRQVNDFVFERSDDFAFSQDLVTFRGKWRVGGALIDTLAGASLVQNV